MRYRATCLTPLLVGDGRKLSPIDYMVWKDHVNVLDQWRIFRLLAKGAAPGRLPGAVEKGRQASTSRRGVGFAQNFAGRRIPFENAAYSNYWNRAIGDSLHIPTFSFGRLRAVPAGNGDQRRPAHGHGLRQLARRNAPGCEGARPVAAVCRAARPKGSRIRRLAAVDPTGRG